MSESDGGAFSESPVASHPGNPESGVEVAGRESVEWGVGLGEELNV